MLISAHDRVFCLPIRIEAQFRDCEGYVKIIYRRANIFPWSLQTPNSRRLLPILMQMPKPKLYTEKVHIFMRPLTP